MSHRVDGLPQRTHALRLQATSPTAHTLVLDDVPVPSPGPGEVLVRVFSTPVHAEDHRFLTGELTLPRPLPTALGVEGVGQVVGLGPHTGRKGWLGQRVAFAPDPAVSGSWAGYVVVPKSQLIFLPKGLSNEAASLLLHLPGRVLAGLALAPSHRPGLLVRAHDEATGRLALALGLASGLKVVLVAPGEPTARTLSTHGADVTLAAGSPGFLPALRRACLAHDVGLCLDGEGDALSGEMVRAVPAGARWVVWEAEPGAAFRVSTADLITSGKQLLGVPPGAWRDVSLFQGPFGLRRPIRQVAKQVLSGKTVVINKTATWRGDLQAPSLDLKLGAKVKPSYFDIPADPQGLADLGEPTSGDG